MWEVINIKLVVLKNKQTTFIKRYPTFFVMPGGICLSICRVCDLSNFMVCKCNFPDLKGLLEGWMEGKCCLPQARGWVRRAGESLMVVVTIICGCYDTRLYFLNKQHMEFCGGKKHFTDEVITKGPMLQWLFDVEWFWSPCCKMIGLTCQYTKDTHTHMYTQKHTHTAHPIIIL